jgi:S-adenosylmethionine:tRNA ribosyltransferase-isomerase
MCYNPVKSQRSLILDANIFDISNYDYRIPRELIAQRPLEKRDASRLLVLDRKSGSIKHDKFYNIAEYFDPGDCIVLNDTKVLPARLFGKTEKTGAGIEILVLEHKQADIWEVMMKNSRRVKEGTRIIFPGGIELIVLKKQGKIVEAEFNMKEGDLKKALWLTGKVPLPPYIKENTVGEIHRLRYQTVYAESEGAKAAPTAGLHFTKTLLEKIRGKRVRKAFVTLHVGIGTFEAVMEKDVRKHRMHEEYFEINSRNAGIINSTKGRVAAVGTTALRALESAAGTDGRIGAKTGYTGLYLFPGCEFRRTDMLITNFHMPRTTLFILVCAFAGIENAKKAYTEAINHKYRLYSYGDAMLIR